MSCPAFAVAVACTPLSAHGAQTACPLTTASKPRQVARSVRRGASLTLERSSPSLGGGDSGSIGGRGRGDGGSGWRPDDTPEGDGDDAASTDGAVVPFVDRLLRGSAIAALAGYSVSSLLEERNPGALHMLSEPDFKEAGLVGLFGFIVHGLGGKYYYNLLEDLVSGSTPIPVAIKTCIDAFFFLPLVANTFDAFARYAKSSKSPGFLNFVKGRDQSSVNLLRRRALWVPAQAISFWFLPPWWRIGFVSIIMVFCSFVNLASSSSPGIVVT